MDPLAEMHLLLREHGSEPERDEHWRDNWWWKARRVGKRCSSQSATTVLRLMRELQSLARPDPGSSAKSYEMDLMRCLTRGPYRLTRISWAS